ncbi:MAG: WD40 repeat domain-containing protein [Coleofasciculus sp. E2-BRE-01]
MKLSGEQIYHFKSPRSPILSISFNPDGKFMATAHQDGTVQIWNLSKLQVTLLKNNQNYEQHIVFLNRHQNSVKSICFSPDGQHLATVSGGMGRVWNLSGQLFAQLNENVGTVVGLCFSPDSQRLATTSVHGEVQLWDISAKFLARWNTHQSKIYVVTFAPSQAHLLTAGENGNISLWNLAGQQLAQLDNPRGWIRHASFSPGMHYLVAAGADGKVRLWRVISQPINTQLFNSILSSNPDNAQWQIKNLEGVDYNVIFCYEFQDSARINSVTCSPGWQSLPTKCIATIGTDGIISLWDVSGNVLTQWNTNRGELKSISFHPDGQRIATAGIDGTVCWWDLSGDNLGEWKAHQGEATSISCSPDGQIIATAGADGKAKLWTISGQLLAEFQDHQGAIRTVSFCESGKRIATAGYDGIVRLWRVEGLEELLARGYDWLKDYLVTHPEALKTINSQSLGI